MNNHFQLYVFPKNMEIDFINSIIPITSIAMLKEELQRMNEFDRQFEYLGWDPQS